MTAKKLCDKYSVRYLPGRNAKREIFSLKSHFETSAFISHPFIFSLEIHFADLKAKKQCHADGMVHAEGGQ